MSFGSYKSSGSVSESMGSSSSFGSLSSVGSLGSCGSDGGTSFNPPGGGSSDGGSAGSLGSCSSCGGGSVGSHYCGPPPSGDVLMEAVSKILNPTAPEGAFFDFGEWPLPDYDRLCFALTLDVRIWTGVVADTLSIKFTELGSDLNTWTKGGVLPAGASGAAPADSSLWYMEDVPVPANADSTYITVSSAVVDDPNTQLVETSTVWIEIRYKFSLL